MLLAMINDILDLAKIESGKMEVRSEDFSIRDVCEGLTNLCRPVAERKNITWNAGSTRRFPYCARTRASCGRSSTTCSPTPSSSRPRGAG